ARQPLFQLIFRLLDQTCEVLTEETVLDCLIKNHPGNVQNEIYGCSPFCHDAIDQEVENLKQGQQCTHLRMKYQWNQSGCFAKLDNTFLGESPMVVRMGMIKPDMRNRYYGEALGLEDALDFTNTLEGILAVLQDLSAKH